MSYIYSKIQLIEQNYKVSLFFLLKIKKKKKKVNAYFNEEQIKSRRKGMTKGKQVETYEGSFILPVCPVL